MDFSAGNFSGASPTPDGNFYAGFPRLAADTLTLAAQALPIPYI